MKIEKINIKDKFNSISELWSPKIIGKLNGQHIKIAVIKGEFISHFHEGEDEFFLVLEGELLMELEEKTIELNEGECIIIPKGCVHKPIARNIVKLLLFEPETTVNTGNVENELTKHYLEEL